MIRPIIKDVFFLMQKSVPAKISDMTIARDMEDTLKAHSDECVGLAANMIGENKCIISFSAGDKPVTMFNPVIKEKKGEYVAEEGCLSLDKISRITRYENITVEYFDKGFKKRRNTYSGFIAQIIQHEVDHTNGILV